MLNLEEWTLSDPDKRDGHNMHVKVRNNGLFRDLAQRTLIANFQKTAPKSADCLFATD